MESGDPVTDLKKHFGSLLKKYIRESSCRQVDIAAALELSPSAVSQMVSGRMCPNLKQLDVITRTLSLDRTACAELRDCLMRIRSGDDQMRSPLNDFIKSERIRCGLTVEQLSQVCGIKQDTLIMLENKLNVQPTPWEAVRLAAIFNCNLSELWQSVPDQEASSVLSEVSAAQKYGHPVLRDNSAPYRADASSHIKTPVIRFEDLKKFNAKFDHLIDFAWRHMVEYKSNLPVGIVLVRAQGEDFGWPPVYQVMLEIAEAAEWIPGMGVLCRVGENMVLGRAGSRVGYVSVLGCAEEQLCEKYFLLNALRWESGLFAVTASSNKSAASDSVNIPDGFPGN